MKRPSLILLAVIVALVLGLGISFRLARPSPQKRAEQPIPKPAEPTLFSALPPQSNYTQYAQRIHSLGHDLSKSQQLALVKWMTGPKPVHIQDREWHFLVNEAMDCLCHQNQPLASLSNILIRIVRDTSNGIVIRDYAIQHCVDWIQPGGMGIPHETNPVKRQALLATLLDAAGEKAESLSGTALQSLNLILKQQQRIQTKPSTTEVTSSFGIHQLRIAAVALATAEETNDLARITAFQVCAQHEFEEILPIIRAVAAEPSKPASLRLSAIAAIGQLGNIEDLPLFEKIQLSSSASLLGAMRLSINRIKERNNTGSQSL